MPLIIRAEKIYTSEGELLKEISCPRHIAKHDLDGGMGNDYRCGHCTESVLNTDLMTESDLVSALKENPDACLFINLANPIFKVQL